MIRIGEIGMGKKKKELEETKDMSMTFIAEVGQKSAVADDTLSDISGIPDVKVNPPTKEELEEFHAEVNEKNASHKKGPIITIILMILCLAIGFCSSKFLFSDKSSKKNESNKDTVEKEKETEKDDEIILTDSLFVKELISRYNYQYLDDYAYEVLYSKEEVSIKEMDEDYLQMLTAIKANKNPILVHFTSEDFQEAVTLLFGDQVMLDNKDISFDKCNKIVFDEKTNTYSSELKDGCGVSSSLMMKNEVVRVQKKDKSLEVDVAVAIVDENADKVYKKYNLEKKEGEEELEDKKASEFDISVDYSDLNQYQYIFDYDSTNNNYYLNRIELIK